MAFFIMLLIVALAFGLLGKLIGELGDKNNGNYGFAFGALLGPIGCLITALLPPNKDVLVPPTKGAEDETQRKIAELETQLAALKTGSTPATKAITAPIDDDGGIPTYRLD